eukprot:CAMPEP_0117037900 /NCGR_PEP_ID=MMETSP0472-20121206/26707_1 /TAXON_ID=693140 ORGANISM="Tiarina fusus, Strain LIS" /NCGR_SAMPLE_ID=MMETSP0472 /ASSEMBLY_ACC=CAM_ASM_000603 /LENGTH=176 /DNA_ID=CAMNT_0004747985 /DNA_START=128 /DNA_END=658 /DNA_ORIENTATION=+
MTPDDLGLDTYEQVDAKIKDKKESFLSVYQSYKNYLTRLDMEEAGPVNPEHFSIYQHMPRQPFTVEEFFNYVKGTEYDPECWTVDQLEEFFFVPTPVPFTVGLYLRNLVAYRTLRKLGFRGPQQVEVAKKFNISGGEPTLEMLLPSPAPFHTYEEACIIKEPPGFVAEEEEEEDDH